MDTQQILYKQLSYQIVGAGMTVHSTLGPGLQELAYEKSLKIEFGKRDIIAIRQPHYDIIYEEERVGFFIPDIVVEDKVILEIKVVDRVTDNHFAQVMSYLRVTGHRVAYIFNFNLKSFQFKRLIL